MGSTVRLIDGWFYEGTPADEYELVVRRLGNGHAEGNIRRTVAWRELGPARADELELWQRCRDETEAERREANSKRAARRATTRVRRVVKVAGLDSLLTLTYRCLQPDLALCKRHLKEFVRRMRRLIPGWQYVAAFERQARGSWHVHMAVHKLPMRLPASTGVKVKSYGVVRAVWRSVVGLDNGNIDESRRRRFSGRSSAKVASYISKYMLKAFQEGDAWSNRYSAGGLGALPQPVVERFRAASLAELLPRVFDEMYYSGCECWYDTRPDWDSGSVDGFFMSVGPPGRTRPDLEVCHE